MLLILVEVLEIRHALRARYGMPLGQFRSCGVVKYYELRTPQRKCNRSKVLIKILRGKAPSHYPLPRFQTTPPMAHTLTLGQCCVNRPFCGNRPEWGTSPAKILNLIHTHRSGDDLFDAVLNAVLWLILGVLFGRGAWRRISE
jgi:hypothetical protein